MNLRVQEKNSYFLLREKRRPTRDHLGFCAGTEGGKGRTSKCAFAWETGRRKQAGKMDETTPKQTAKRGEGLP